MEKTEILRRSEESEIAYQLRRLGEVLLRDFQDGLLERRFADALMDPAYGVEFTTGFFAGFMDGGAGRLRAWRNDLQDTLDVLVEFVRKGGIIELGVASGVSLYEFFGVNFKPGRPGQLSPEVSNVLERLELIHGLAPVFRALDLLNEQAKAHDLLKLLGMVAEDVVASLISSGGDFVRRFLLATGAAAMQGEILGRFSGEAFVELIRAFVEPPELSMLELIGALGLSDDEVAALTAP